MEQFGRSLHLCLTDEQYARLRRIAKHEGRTMTSVARGAIVARIAFIEEEERLLEAEKEKKRARENAATGLGIDFSQFRRKPAEESNDTMSQLSNATRAIRALCKDPKDAEALIVELTGKLSKPPVPFGSK